MAQAISKQVPAFCLACIGTNNCFSTDDVLKLWKYIYLSVKLMASSVVGFGADGDTRALKAVKSSCQLLDSFDKCMLKLSLGMSLFYFFLTDFSFLFFYLFFSIFCLSTMYLAPKLVYNLIIIITWNKSITTVYIQYEVYMLVIVS